MQLVISYAVECTHWRRVCLSEKWEEADNFTILTNHLTTAMFNFSPYHFSANQSLALKSAFNCIKDAALHLLWSLTLTLPLFCFDTKKSTFPSLPLPSPLTKLRDNCTHTHSYTPWIIILSCAQAHPPTPTHTHTHTLVETEKGKSESWREN